jgi:hypothetical protein
MNAAQKKLAKAWARFYGRFTKLLAANPDVADLIVAAVEMFEAVNSDPSVLAEPLLEEAMAAGLANAQKAAGKRGAGKKSGRRPAKRGQR